MLQPTKVDILSFVKDKCGEDAVVSIMQRAEIAALKATIERLQAETTAAGAAEAAKPDGISPEYIERRQEAERKQHEAAQEKRKQALKAAGLDAGASKT